MLKSGDLSLVRACGVCQLKGGKMPSRGDSQDKEGFAPIQRGLLCYTNHYWRLKSIFLASTKNS